MANIKSKYNIGQIVYLITDQEQSIRMITAIKFDGGILLYNLAQGTSGSWHYEIEISKEKNILISLGVEMNKNRN